MRFRDPLVSRAAERAEKAARRALRSETERPRAQGESLVPWQWMETILVIEDDTAVLEQLISGLRGGGYDVFAFTSGDDALTWLWSGVPGGDVDCVPAAILCDVRIARGSGAGFLDSLRQIAEGIPMILIRDAADEASREQVLQLNAHCVLEHPFAAEALRAAVDDLVAAKVAAG